MSEHDESKSGSKPEELRENESKPNLTLSRCNSVHEPLPLTIVLEEPIFDTFDLKGEPNMDRNISEIFIAAVFKREKRVSFSPQSIDGRMNHWNESSSCRQLLKDGDKKKGIKRDLRNLALISTMDKESDGSLRFFLIDAHEEINGPNAGKIYLFGKVKAQGVYENCCICVNVKHMQRCIYAIPTVPITCDDIFKELEENIEAFKLSPIDCEFTEEVRPTEFDEFNQSINAHANQLKVLAGRVTREVAHVLQGLPKICSPYVSTVVRRHTVLGKHRADFIVKINYSFKDPPLRSTLSGQYYCAVLGTHDSALERFLDNLNIGGPSWLSISNFSRCSKDVPQASWCKFEVNVDSPRDIQVSTTSENISEIPSVTVAEITLKTIKNEAKINEIVSVSVICFQETKITAPMLDSELRGRGRYTTFVSKIDTAAQIDEVIHHLPKEFALLTGLMYHLKNLDPDVYKISRPDLELLLYRLQDYSGPGSLWNKIGRLKCVLPKVGEKSVIPGCLVWDN